MLLSPCQLFTRKFSRLTLFHDVQAVAHPGEESIPAVRPVNVLLLGDSIDFRIARNLCNISKHEEHLEKFTDDPISQEHNMTGPFPVLLCTQKRPCCREVLPG